MRQHTLGLPKRRQHPRQGRDTVCRVRLKSLQINNIHYTTLRTQHAASLLPTEFAVEYWRCRRNFLILQVTLYGTLMPFLRLYYPHNDTYEEVNVNAGDSPGAGYEVSRIPVALQADTQGGFGDFGHRHDHPVPLRDRQHL